MLALLNTKKKKKLKKNWLPCSSSCSCCSCSHARSSLLPPPGGGDAGREAGGEGCGGAGGGGAGGRRARNTTASLSHGDRVFSSLGQARAGATLMGLCRVVGRAIFFSFAGCQEGAGGRGGFRRLWPGIRSLSRVAFGARTWKGVAHSEFPRSGDPALQPLGEEAAWCDGIMISRLLRLLRLEAGNNDYDYDEGRYLFFRLVAQGSREKNLLIPAAAGSFSLDATLGLLATRRRLGRRGDSSAMRSAFVVSSCVL